MIWVAEGDEDGYIGIHAVVFCIAEDRHPCSGECVFYGTYEIDEFIEYEGINSKALHDAEISICRD